MFRKIFMKWQKDMKMIKKGENAAFYAMKCACVKRAEAAKMGNFDYFTTTLSISPLKECPEVKRDRYTSGKRIRHSLSYVGFQEKEWI